MILFYFYRYKKLIFIQNIIHKHKDIVNNVACISIHVNCYIHVRLLVIDSLLLLIHVQNINCELLNYLFDLLFVLFQ